MFDGSLMNIIVVTVMILLLINLTIIQTIIWPYANLVKSCHGVQAVTRFAYGHANREVIKVIKVSSNKVIKVSSNKNNKSVKL